MKDYSRLGQGDKIRVVIEDSEPPERSRFTVGYFTKWTTVDGEQYCLRNF